MMTSSESSPRPPAIISLLTASRLQIVVALLSLCAIVIFASSFYYLRPYDGLDLLIENGTTRVLEVFKGGPAEKAGVRVDDVVLAIGDEPAPRWGNRPLYGVDVDVGDTVVYEVQRNGEELTIPITLAGYQDNPSLFGALAGTIVLAVGIWVVGVILSLFAPRRDVRAHLIGMGWMVAGISMAVGIPGQLAYFWGADTIFKATWCVIAFTNIASHLYFPVKRLSSRVRNIVVYAAAAVSTLLFLLILVEDLYLAPRLRATGLGELVFLWFLVSVLASLGLLLHNYFSSKNDKDARRQTGIVLWGTALGFAPFFVLTLFPLLLSGGEVEYVAGHYTVLGIVLVPLSYAYVINQRRLLRVDLIINRGVVFFVLILLVLVFSILILGLIGWIFDLPSMLPVWGGFIAAAVVLPSAVLRERVQIRVNEILYGSHYDFSTVTSAFSSRLAQTLDRDTLNELLTQELSEQMGIYNAALLLADGKRLTLQGAGEAPFSAPADDQLSLFLLNAQMPVRAQHLWGLVEGQTEQKWNRFSWGELFAPLVFEGKLHGLLILGLRASGDVYSGQDIQIIATVAHQAALAFANVRLVETLRGLAQSLVRDDEERRKNLARDLHDAVLQNLFLIQHRLHRDDKNEELVAQMDNIIQTLRQVIKAQRSAFLDQAVSLALQDLSRDMQKLAGEQPLISWINTVEGDIKLSDEQTTSLYRITQEAITNAIKHAQAENIYVKFEHGTKGSYRVLVEDDGIGLEETAAIQADATHYGFLGMWERATMINAELSIEPRSGRGTIVTVELCKAHNGAG